MVQAAGPIDGDVGVFAVEADGGADGAAGGGAAEVEEAVEDGAVLADVEALELTVVGVGILGEDLRRDGGEEVDVVVGVEAADVGLRRGEGAVDLHAAVEAVVNDEVVGHANAVRLHRMPLPVVVVADARLVEVRYSPLLRVRAHRGQRNATLCLRSLPSRHNTPNPSFSLCFFSLPLYTIHTELSNL